MEGTLCSSYYGIQFNQNTPAGAGGAQSVFFGHTMTNLVLLPDKDREAIRHFTTFKSVAKWRAE